MVNLESGVILSLCALSYAFPALTEQQSVAHAIEARGGVTIPSQMKCGDRVFTKDQIVASKNQIKIVEAANTKAKSKKSDYPKLFHNQGKGPDGKVIDSKKQTLWEFPMMDTGVYTGKLRFNPPHIF